MSWAGLCTASLLWFIYGAVHKEKPIMFANAIARVILIELSLNENNFSESEGVLIYVFGKTVSLTILLIMICYETGEKAEWRWGKKD